MDTICITILFPPAMDGAVLNCISELSSNIDNFQQQFWFPLELMNLALHSDFAQRKLVVAAINALSDRFKNSLCVKVKLDKALKSAYYGEVGNAIFKSVFWIRSSHLYQAKAN